MNRLIGYSACASLMLTVCVGPCLPLFDAGWLAAVTLVFTIVAGCTAWQTPPGRIAQLNCANPLRRGGHKDAAERALRDCEEDNLAGSSLCERAGLQAEPGRAGLVKAAG